MYDTSMLNGEILAWLPFLIVGNLIYWIYTKIRGKN